MNKVIDIWTKLVIALQVVPILITAGVFVFADVSSYLFIVTGFGGHAYWVCYLIALFTMIGAYRTKKPWVLGIPAGLFIAYSLCAVTFLDNLIATSIGFLGEALVWYLGVNIAIAFGTSFIATCIISRKAILLTEDIDKPERKPVFIAIAGLSVLDILSFAVLYLM